MILKKTSEILLGSILVFLLSACASTTNNETLNTKKSVFNPPKGNIFKSNWQPVNQKNKLRFNKVVN